MFKHLIQCTGIAIALHASQFTATSAEQISIESYRIGDSMLSVFGSLSNSDTHEIESSKIDAVHVSGDADQNLFKEKLLNRIKHVVLKTNINSLHLKNLAASQPQLKLLCVVQTYPLNNDELLDLKAFTVLDTLEINCPISFEKLSGSLSKSLKFLILTNAGGAPLQLNNDEVVLPKLLSLNLNNSEVAASFFQKLSLPELQSIRLRNISLEPTAIQRLSHFEKLRELNLDNCTFDSADIELLKKLMPDLSVKVRDFR